MGSGAGGTDNLFNIPNSTPAQQAQMSATYQSLVQQWASIIQQQEGIDATTLPQWPVILQELQLQARNQVLAAGSTPDPLGPGLFGVAA